MKHMKRIFLSVLVFALVACVPGLGSVKVKAAEPSTYTIKYIPSMDEWRSQKLSTWDDSRENGNLDFVWGNIREGDSLVIIGGEGSPKFDDLHIDFKLANLTLFAVKGSIIVYADQNIKDIYVLKGTVASLHGSYDNVYVYDDCACNVNNDVKYLYVGGESSMKMNVNALGTVEHCKIENKGTVIREMYNVKAKSLSVESGTDKTDPSAYSTTKTATPATTTQSTTSSANAATATTATGGIASPKTGEGHAFLLLLAGAAFCFAGFGYARKRTV